MHQLDARQALCWGLSHPESVEASWEPIGKVGHLPEKATDGQMLVPDQTVSERGRRGSPSPTTCLHPEDPGPRTPSQAHSVHPLVSGAGEADFLLAHSSLPI